jgi:hypothetical protein
VRRGWPPLSAIRAVCASERPYGSVRGVRSDPHPYRDRVLTEAFHKLVAAIVVRTLGTACGCVGDVKSHPSQKRAKDEAPTVW